MKKYIVVLMILIVQVSLAQKKYFYINLDVNKPLSNTAWVGDVSSKGVRAGYRVFVTSQISAGLDVSWATFSQYDPTRTIESATGAITTDYFRYIYSYSIAASGQYNFNVGDRERFFPYAGLGLGAANNEYALYYNVYKDNQQSWGFLVRPEAGILIRLYRSLGAMAGVHYDYSTSKSEKFRYDNFSSLGFQIGLVMMNM